LIIVISDYGVGNGGVNAWNNAVTSDHGLHNNDESIVKLRGHPEIFDAYQSNFATLGHDALDDYPMDRAGACARSALAGALLEQGRDGMERLQGSN
jgi:hypothetical protein